MIQRETLVETIIQHRNLVDEFIEPMSPLLDTIGDVGDMLRQSTATVFICGNGGSASDAQHFAAELVGRFRVERRPRAAVALNTDTSALTAIANDYGYEEVFARQIAALGKPNDVLIAISTSGRSPNINYAVREAKRRGMITVALTGLAGLLETCDYNICVPSMITARVQEMHILILHLLCEFLEEN